jgi:hypothetical protein
LSQVVLARPLRRSAHDPFPHHKSSRARDRIGDQALVRFGRGRLLDDDRFDPDIAGGVLTPIGRRRSPRGRSSYVAST